MDEQMDCDLRLIQGLPRLTGPDRSVLQDYFDIPTYAERVKAIGAEVSRQRLLAIHANYFGQLVADPKYKKREARVRPLA